MHYFVFLHFFLSVLLFLVLFFTFLFSSSVFPHFFVSVYCCLLFPFIFHYLRRSFLCIMSVFSFPSFIPVFSGILFSYLYLLTYFPPTSFSSLTHYFVCLFLTAFFPCFLVRRHCRFLMFFPCDYQTCTEECTCKPCFLPQLPTHDLSVHSLGYT